MTRSISSAARRSSFRQRTQLTRSSICSTDAPAPELRVGSVDVLIRSSASIVEFDEPQPISRLVYEVEEVVRERTQEVRVEVCENGRRTYRQILVQEYNFSPGGGTYQREELRFSRLQASCLRLTIVPNKNGSGTATLTTLRLFA